MTQTATDRKSIPVCHDCGRYTCGDCGQGFATKDAYLRHRVEEPHGDRGAQGEPEPAPA